MPLDLLNEGEQPIGIFFEAQNQIDRLYYGELFGEVVDGQQAISNEMLSSYADGAVTIEFLDERNLNGSEQRSDPRRVHL